MERQAISALSHVADAVLFLLDPSESCGYELASQMRLLDTVHELFPDIPILVVENKADLATTGLGRRAMSALTGKGVKDVLDEMVRLSTSPAPGAAPPPRAG